MITNGRRSTIMSVSSICPKILVFINPVALVSAEASWKLTLCGGEIPKSKSKETLGFGGGWATERDEQSSLVVG